MRRQVDALRRLSQISDAAVRQHGGDMHRALAAMQAEMRKMSGSERDAVNDAFDILRAHSAQSRARSRQ